MLFILILEFDLGDNTSTKLAFVIYIDLLIAYLKQKTYRLLAVRDS